MTNDQTIPKKPEESARETIDNWLTNAGWNVVDRGDFLPDSPCVVREAIIRGNQEADYLFFIRNKAVAVLEAKRREVSLDIDVCKQVERYAAGIQKRENPISIPLPLCYVSNGVELKFKNGQSEYLTIDPQKMHSPHEMARLLGIGERFAGMPHFSQRERRELRDCQFDAVMNLERSFAGTAAGNYKDGKKKALIQLSMGVGKTYTAAMIAYRLLNFANFKRVLYLADRNNLVKQTEAEFFNFRNTRSGESFPSYFNVLRLKSSDINELGSAGVVIATVQRLYSLLKGDAIDDTCEFDEFKEDDEPRIEIGSDLKLPPDFFDLIIIDECHRSIYNKNSWGSVVSYFKDAYLIGLSATPADFTVKYFDDNVVVKYDYENAVRDGINVPHNIHRIETEISKNGLKIKRGEKYVIFDKFTGIPKEQTAEHDIEISPNELNRLAFVPEQIKAIMEEFRKRVYTDFFPNRNADFSYLPKTLVFAANELHADLIVKIIKEVFKPDNENFVKKITYSVPDSGALIREFNMSPDFRIAVTVTLVATGTDVRSLETVMFLRDVNTEGFFRQMWGRGVRTIQPEALREVTPNAVSKEFFWIVDAVGVTEKCMESGTLPLQSRRSFPLPKVIEDLYHEIFSDDILYNLATALVSLSNRKINDIELVEKFKELTGTTFFKIASNIFSKFDAERNCILPPFVPGGENNERRALVQVIVGNKDVGKLLLKLYHQQYLYAVEIGDRVTNSETIRKQAQENVAGFEKFLEKDYENDGFSKKIINGPAYELTYQRLSNFQMTMINKNAQFDLNNLWESYGAVRPEDVLQKGGDKSNVANIIPLVRFALKKTKKLTTLDAIFKQRFELWCGQKQRLVPVNENLRLKEALADFVFTYLAVNGALATAKDLAKVETGLAARLFHCYNKNYELENEELQSLSNFLIYE